MKFMKSKIDVPVLSDGILDSTFVNEEESASEFLEDNDVTPVVREDSKGEHEFGTSTRYLYVGISEARDLFPKDGEGSSSPFCTVEFDATTKRSSIKAQTLNPVWNEKFSFSFPYIKKARTSEEAKENLEINIFTNVKTGQKQTAFLGRVRIPISFYGDTDGLVRRGLEEVQWHPLEKRGVLSRVSGKIGITLAFGDDPGPIADSFEFPLSVSDVFSSIEPSAPVKEVGALRTGSGQGSMYDLVDNVQYVFVQILQARSLPARDILKGTTDPYVRLSVSNITAQTKTVPKEQNPEWNQVFAIAAEKITEDGGKDAKRVEMELAVMHEDRFGPHDFLGSITIPLNELPTRTPGEPSILPTWYKLQKRTGVKLRRNATIKGDLLVAVWIGFQSDEMFPNAWHSDTGGSTQLRSREYFSPRLWYLRVIVLEADGLQISSNRRLPDLVARVRLGVQKRQTGAASNKASNPVWNESFLLTAAEPFEENLIVEVVDTVAANTEDIVGQVIIPLKEIETRVVHNAPISSRWLPLGKSSKSSFPSSASANSNSSSSSSSASSLPSSFSTISTSNNPSTTTTTTTSSLHLYPSSPSSSSSLSSPFSSRLRLRLCFEGGYHVAEEPLNHSSSYSPSSSPHLSPSPSPSLSPSPSPSPSPSLSPSPSPPLGKLVLGLIGAKSLPLMKNSGPTWSGGCTDSYVVAKYGRRWVRSRTVRDSVNPRWNEQYGWEVYDPCTVIMLAVFDNRHLKKGGLDTGGSKDQPIGKIRIRLSALESNKVYTNCHPLLVLTKQGVKKMGEVELAIKFSCDVSLNVVRQYTEPLLPVMHYMEPIESKEQELLRLASIQYVTTHLSQSEPPLRPEVVQFMLDTDENMFSLRRMKANIFRLKAVLAGPIAFFKFMTKVMTWQSPSLTLFVHLLYALLIYYPGIVVPAVLLCIGLLGLKGYSSRPLSPPFMDEKLSQGVEREDVEEGEELEEEMDSSSTSSFSTSSSTSTPQKDVTLANPMKYYRVLKGRYEQLKRVAAEIQTATGVIASYGEKVQSILSWRDPRATAIFSLACLLAAFLLYVLPPQPLLVIGGWWAMRHPSLRTPTPPAPANFISRLHSLADSVY